MTYNKKTIEDIDVSGKKVLVRCDFNVPVKDGVITSDKRIVEALPTIRYLKAHGAMVILCSHMGKPHNVLDEKLKLNKKEIAKIEALPAEEQEAARAAALEKAAKDRKKLSLSIVADKLNELLGGGVVFATDTVGADAQAKVAAMKPGDIVLLENTRFTAAEEKNDPEFSRKLAAFAEIFVNDAFGTAHRAHASTAVITKYIPTSVAGFLMEKEIAFLGNAVEKPVRPFVAILGGAKVSDKLAVVSNLLTKVNTLIIGGGMAYTFLKAQGHNVGNSLCEMDQLQYANDMIAKAKELGVNFLLPVDNVAADKFDAEANTQIVGDDIPEGWMALDIGPKTVELYSNAIKGAKTVVWNGPMGCFEMEKFSKGTFGVCEAVAEVKANGGVSIIGGGDSVAAVNKSGLADKMSHISTGGGASLEFLEGKALPGVVALSDK